MTLPTQSDDGELEAILKRYQLDVIANYDAGHVLSIEKDKARQTAIKQLHLWATKQRISEANIIDDRLYDISSTEWGIPTKWSKEKSANNNYADLWSPNEAIHEVLQNRIAVLEAEMKGEKL